MRDIPSRARPTGRARLLMLAGGGLAVIGALVFASLPAGPAFVPAPPPTTAPVAAAEPALAREELQVRPGDTLARILASRGQTPATVHAVMQSGPDARGLSAIRAGARLVLTTDATGELVELSYAEGPLSTLLVTRGDAGNYLSELREAETVTATRYAEGVIDDSLFATGKRAGVGDGMILKMADVFAYDVDFALEVQPGDTFRLVYEEVLAEGQKVRDGELLSAEFINQGKTYRAIRFVNSEGRASYYTPEGMAMRKAFLRSPVDFARISSRFNLQRRHPVLHTLRAHKGVDYAAARGTPVRATADGRVEYAGNKGGYGKTVILQHGNQYTTLYAHLDRFAKNVRSGSRVSQGQVIGYVGSTGLSTGPHLHYEFRVAGTHVDPLRRKPVQADPIAASEREAFLAEASRLIAMMDSFGGRTAVAQAAGPDDGSRRF